jgi:hypothetical protein
LGRWTSYTSKLNQRALCKEKEEKSVITSGEMETFVSKECLPHSDGTMFQDELRYRMGRGRERVCWHCLASTSSITACTYFTSILSVEFRLALIPRPILDLRKK